MVREFIAASADSTVQTVDAADHLTFLLGSGNGIDQAEVSVWRYATGSGSGCQFRIHYSVTKLG